MLRLDFVLTSPQTKPTTCVHSFSRDLWAGLRRATAVGIYDLTTFDKTEYFYYDNPVNGDLHEVVPGKFIAFKGPKDADFRDLPCDMVSIRLSVLCRVHTARTWAHSAQRQYVPAGTYRRRRPHAIATLLPSLSTDIGAFLAAIAGARIVHRNLQRQKR